MEVYQANKLGSNCVSFSMVNREPHRAWTAFPVMLVKWSATHELSFPKDSISAARLTPGSSRNRACLHQETEKLKANHIGYITPRKRIGAEHRKKQKYILISIGSLLHAVTRRRFWQHSSIDSHQLSNRIEEIWQEK